MTSDHIPFEQQLHRLAESMKKGPVTITTLQGIAGREGLKALIIFLVLPFLQPVPVPGLSVPLGLIVAALGLQLMQGRPLPLPFWIGRVKDRTLPPRLLRLMIQPTGRVWPYIRSIMTVRWQQIASPKHRYLTGLSIILGGLALAMPFPPIVPFSNALPALALLLVCLGAIERDGVVVLFGHSLVIGSWIYFSLFLLGFSSVLQKL